MPRHIMRSSITSRNQGGGNSKAGTGKVVGLDLGAGKGRLGIKRILDKNKKIWKQLGQIIYGNDFDNQAGFSVDINSDGTIIAIGEVNDNSNGEDGADATNDSGKVTIWEYNRMNKLWNKIGQDIVGYDGSSGHSVSLNGNGRRVAISSPTSDNNGIKAGRVRVWEYDDLKWNQIGQDIDGEIRGDLSGESVSLSNDGTIVAIGSPYNDTNGEDSGHARVWKYDGTKWNQIGQTILGEAEGDNSGISVSLSGDGNRIAIGAEYNEGEPELAGTGHVRVWDYDGTKWNQVGKDIDGDYYDARFGKSVSLSKDGTTLVVGSPNAIGNAELPDYTGSVSVFKYINKEWMQIGEDIPGGQFDSQGSRNNSGWSVSINKYGNIVVIGERGYNGNNIDTGLVRIWKWSGTVWKQIGQDIEGINKSDQNGWSVSIDDEGKKIICGAVFAYNSELSTDGIRTGSATVYEYK